MTYPLGTTLIFTELAEAAAAARLFGNSAIQNWEVHNEEGAGWHDDFSTIERYHKDGVTLIANIKKWRIILDTEEKCGWVAPHVYQALNQDLSGTMDVPIELTEDMMERALDVLGRMKGFELKLVAITFYKAMLSAAQKEKQS